VYLRFLKRPPASSAFPLSRPGCLDSFLSGGRLLGRRWGLDFGRASFGLLGRGPLVSARNADVLESHGPGWVGERETGQGSKDHADFEDLHNLPFEPSFAPSKRVIQSSSWGIKSISFQNADSLPKEGTCGIAALGCSFVGRGKQARGPTPHFHLSRVYQSPYKWVFRL